LFSASFNEKLNIDALKFLSAVIAFFKIKPLFYPGEQFNLPDGLDKLSFEISNMSIQEQSNLWSAIGAKYLPSILYKVRLVTIDEKRSCLKLLKLRVLTGFLNNKRDG